MYLELFHNSFFSRFFFIFFLFIKRNHLAFLLLLFFFIGGFIVTSLSSDNISLEHVSLSKFYPPSPTSLSLSHSHPLHTSYGSRQLGASSLSHKDFLQRKKKRITMIWRLILSTLIVSTHSGPLSALIVNDDFDNRISHRERDINNPILKPNSIVSIKNTNNIRKHDHSSFYQSVSNLKKQQDICVSSLDMSQKKLSRRYKKAYGLRHRSPMDVSAILYIFIYVPSIAFLLMSALWKIIRGDNNNIRNHVSSPLPLPPPPPTSPVVYHDGQRSSITIILGPMGAGKSSRLRSMYLVHKISSSKRAKGCLLIKFKGDDRFNTRDNKQMLVTRNYDSVEADFIVDKLKDLDENIIKRNHYIFIDEGQLFPDLKEYVLKWAIQYNINVIISALDAYANQTLWENIASLLPYAKYEKLLAVCDICGDEAALTMTHEDCRKGKDGCVINETLHPSMSLTYLSDPSSITPRPLMSTLKAKATGVVKIGGKSIYTSRCIHHQYDDV
jgi:thymidine kinase